MPRPLPPASWLLCRGAPQRPPCERSLFPETHEFSSTHSRCSACLWKPRIIPKVQSSRFRVQSYKSHLSSEPETLNLELLHDPAAIHVERLAGDVLRPFRGEENGHV